MQAFIQYTPTEIIFGRGVEDRVAELVKKYGGSRIMLVYGGGSVEKSGLLGRLEALLEKAGIAYLSFGGAKPNPLLSHAQEGVARALEFGADMAIGIGGGSAIDTAKAIAHGAANPDTDLWKFWSGELELKKSLPIGVVLTISAAGSETSSSAVLTNSEFGRKSGINTDFNRPKFALMDPELTFTLPPYQISCGTIDILMHTLDRYFTMTEGNQLTDEIAEALMRVVIENGPKALKNPKDYDAMSELMWCGSLSHNGLTGLGRPMEFSIHKLGHELSAMFDIAHGASLSTMWGSWALYVFKMKPERFARYAKKVWGVETDHVEEAALAGIEKTIKFFQSLDMPTCFSESKIGIQPDAVIEDLAMRCSFNETRKIGFFKQLGKEDLYQIYNMANK